MTAPTDTLELEGRLRDEVAIFYGYATANEMLNSSDAPASWRENDTRWKAATALAAQREQIEALKREADDDNDLIDRLSKLLAETSIALKGPESPLHRHSYHDVPKVAAEIALACRIGDELLRQEREKVAAAERKLAECERDAEMLRENLRWARKFIPEHDGFVHNDYLPKERAECAVCQCRTAIDAAIDKARQDAKE